VQPQTYCAVNKPTFPVAERHHASNGTARSLAIA